MKTKPPASNVEWQAWAKRDPLYAVATCPDKDKQGADPWTDEAFYALGKSDWEDFYRRWIRYGLDHASCAEIGCGAGRITRFMAGNFDAVHAFDVSEDMLEYARKHVALDHVKFYLSDGSWIDLPQAAVSAVFSCHVFQHFDSLAVARHYFREIHRVLADQGTLMIHLPIYAWPYPSVWFRGLHGLSQRVGDFKANRNRRLIARGIFRPLMRRLVYPLDWFFTELPRLGFGDIEIAVIAPQSSGDPHPFVLARKTGRGGD